MAVLLSTLHSGQKGTISSIEADWLEIALLNMGVFPGEKFQVAEKAPWGGPIALCINGTKVALRYSHATHVRVTLAGDSHSAIELEEGEGEK